MPAFKKEINGKSNPVHDQLTDALQFIGLRHLRAVSMHLTYADAYNILFPPEDRVKWAEFSDRAVSHTRGGDIAFDTGVSRNCSLYIRADDGAPILPKVAYIATHRGECDEAANNSYRRIMDAMAEFVELRKKVASMRDQFDIMNNACDNPRQMRAIWPGLVQLLEWTRNDACIDIAGQIMKYVPLRKEIDFGMSRNQYREWAGLIGSGMMMSRNEPLLPQLYFR